MTRRQAVPTVLMLLVAALIAGCSSSGSSSGTSGSSAADWANGVCSALGSWKSSIQSAGSSITGGNLSKNSLQAAADSVSTANDKLQSDLSGLKTPDTTAGKQAKQSVDQLSATLNTGADSIKAAVKGVSGITGIPAAAATIGSTLANMKNQFSATFDSLRSAKGELKSAFQQAPQCQQLSPSSHSS